MKHISAVGWEAQKGLKLGQVFKQAAGCGWQGSRGRYRLMMPGSWGGGGEAWTRVGLPPRLLASGWERGTSRAMGAARDGLASHLQEACERSLAEMESSHQQVMQELQRHHERELQRLQQEKEWLLAEETAATASGEGPGQERHSRASPREPPKLWGFLNKR